MITVGGMALDTGDPLVMAGLAAAGVALLLVILLLLVMARAGRAARAAAPLAGEMQELGRSVRDLFVGQERLTGGLEAVGTAQITAQANVVQSMETRLEAVQRAMANTLHDNALKTARSLSDMQEKVNGVLTGSSKETQTKLVQLQERLKTIDRAQENIEKLSGDVLSLQDILSNKQTRGAFGEIQLNDIVSKAMPADSYAFQATLSNGKRADCLIDLPDPPGPIVIDSKFPLEPYEALVAARDDAQRQAATRAMKTAVRTHIRAISERYIIEGETADGALMFLPSEAVYAELHARFGDVVREGFAAGVWIVSPTTCMATLNTMRAILKDARMREQAGHIRNELRLLHDDVGRLEDRVGNLDRHFVQAARDIEDIKISAGKAGKRSRRLESFDFDAIEAEDQQVIAASPGD